MGVVCGRSLAVDKLPCKSLYPSVDCIYITCVGGSDSVARPCLLSDFKKLSINSRVLVDRVKDCSWA